MPSQPTLVRRRIRGTADARMKVHLRRLDLGGMTLHVITLRPATRTLFSTNYFHNTWHVVTDPAGAAVLARLLWGLAYQRRPNTVVLIHGPHLRPTPFEGDPSDPVLLVPARRTPLSARLFGRLRDRLPRLGPPDGTIRWQTFGFDLARRDEAAARARLERELVERLGRDWWWDAERMGRIGRFVCYAAPPEVLRQRALDVAALAPDRSGMDYLFLAHARQWADGEVQIFADYRLQLNAATRARQEVLADPHRPRDRDGFEDAVSARRRQLVRARQGSRRRGGKLHGRCAAGGAGAV
jgi:hypothetical protein